ncbi:hypothetical protein JOD20_001994 [Herpetosiphon giganteus]|nr:hypothetical protein [Herpetosiphon giganteus]
MPSPQPCDHPIGEGLHVVVLRSPHPNPSPVARERGFHAGVLAQCVVKTVGSPSPAFSWERELLQG